MLFEITSWIQSLMVYEIENAKLNLRAFGQTQFITCIFWKNHWKKYEQSIYSNKLCIVEYVPFSAQKILSSGG